VNVRFTSRVVVQIDEALSYIEARSPEDATHVRDRILALISLIEKRPYAGRATSRRNVRRVSVTPYPYLIDYRVSETEIVVLRFRHTARRPLDP
jgi:plasmid stabilization system protein ParE